MKIVKLKTEKDTQELASKIASELKGGEVIGLIGELGAGKTTFTQYLARALDVKGHVNSPTFVLMKNYQTGKKQIRHLVHLDAYRLFSEDELDDLGLDQYINEANSVVVVEWADKIKGYLEKYYPLWITFELKGSNRIAIIKQQVAR